MNRCLIVGVIHTYLHTHTHAYTGSHTYKNICTQMHTYMHTYIHVHAGGLLVVGAARADPQTPHGELHGTLMCAGASLHWRAYT